MALTDIKVKSAKPKDKDYKLFDGDGLFLLVTAKGHKYWRFKYRYDGKEKLLALGTYPERPLVDARQDRDAARRQVAAGIDPSAVRKALKDARSDANANTFEVIAREWHGRFLNTWTTETARDKLARLERNVFPWLGKQPISEIKPHELTVVLQRIADRGVLETAHRVKYVCGQIFRYAVQTGRAERDVTADLRGALPPVKVKNYAALTAPKDVAQLLRDIDSLQASFPVMCALLLAPMLLVRPGELRNAEWSEISLDDAVWAIPASRMKMRQEHLVPLSNQALKILRELHPLTGSGKYVFPSIRTNLRPMSENTINAALRRLGYDKDTMTAHGFRAMARTILDEVLGVRPDFIEHQLAHAVKDPNGRAYNRASHIEERRKMMQLWADYLDGLKAGAKVIPIKKAA